MSLRKKYIVGNWKMNLTMQAANQYMLGLCQFMQTQRELSVVVAPTTVMVQSLHSHFGGRGVQFAAQNLHWAESGAYTGEVSARQLSGLVEYALVGHSERRQLFYETDDDVARKVAAALHHQITPIVCVGETAAQHSQAQAGVVLSAQVAAAFARVPQGSASRVILAYEPVWAIGTGKPAATDLVAERVAAIRRWLSTRYGQSAAAEQTVLYGGSVTACTCEAYMATPGVDGLLIGGASVQLSDFTEIITKAIKLRQS